MVDLSKSQPGVPLWVILAKASDLLVTNPEKAASQARNVLKFAPAQPHALLVLVSARRVQGDTAGARAMLESMAAEHPNLAAVHYELGLLLVELGEEQDAIHALSRVIELEPHHPTAWRVLGDLLAKAGHVERATDAYGRQLASSLVDVQMLEHVMSLGPDQIQIAGTMLREFLTIYSTDVTAIHMLGQVYMRVNQVEAAERMFALAVELAPGFVAARRDYAAALHRQMRSEEESRQLDILLENEPDNDGYRYLKATVLFRRGRFGESIEYCEKLLRENPDNASFWMAYGYALRTIGRQEDCIAAFRKAIQIEPGLGEAWWGLASLKTFHFGTVEIEAMQSQLARDDLRDENRAHMHFALGTALEGKEAYGESFEQYRRGNALRRAGSSYNSDEITQNVQREKAQFTREFFRGIAGSGCPSPDPIFIVGLPRSGSTLIEQILSSHSFVEGAGELPALTAIASRLESKEQARAASGQAGASSLLDGEDLKLLGEEYLERAGAHRRLGRPFFVDKMPKNFHHLGLICAILPNARIVDARRHPLACCFSIYKQLFPSGLGPFYDLTDIGRYYRDYVDLTAHFDEVLPGRVHRVLYEQLVHDPEFEIRRLLKYCELPFEETCLRFYETERGVSTVSSEQVRRPVYQGAIEQWRHYEQWLDPLKDALGPLLDLYPAASGQPAAE